MSSYLVEPDAVVDDTAFVAGDEGRHAIRVARRRVGERVRLFDGQGTSYDAEIVAVERDRLRCRISRILPGAGEPQVAVTLAVGLVKTDRFEIVVEKAVELGAFSIVPFESANSVARAPSETRLRRWNAIALSAAKQSLRSRVPAVETPTTLSSLAGAAPGYDDALVAWEGEPEGALDRTENLAGRQVLLVIGPEGGFTESEASSLREAGARTITLGPRRLRAETAAIAALTLVLDRAGETARPLPR